jgi:hypothetical protein
MNSPQDNVVYGARMMMGRAGTGTAEGDEHEELDRGEEILHLDNAP